MTAGAAALQGLHLRLLRAWSPKTSRHWRPDNPAAGQCGVTAMVVQDLLGGEILKTDVNGAWHFYNRIDGKRIDFTIRQFVSPIFHEDVPAARAEAAQDCTPAQYRALSSALASDGSGRAEATVQSDPGVMICSRTSTRW